MMTKEGSTKIVNSITPGARVLVLGPGHISQIVEMHYFFKISFSTPRHRSDKPNKDKVCSNEEGFNKIVNFIPPEQ